MVIALGHEDLNDHDQLRHDPVLALLSGKLEGASEGLCAAGGEGHPEPARHAPRVASRVATTESSTMRPRCSSRSSTPGGAGGRPLFALLRPGNADPARGVTGPLGRIVERLRRRWPGLEILLRADSAYAREEILAWCEDNGVGYVVGLARNSRLVEKIGWELADAQTEAERRGRPARRFSEFLYATLTSWSRKRRVVGKAEHLPGKSNPRFVVTSLPDTFSARTSPIEPPFPADPPEITAPQDQKWLAHLARSRPFSACKRSSFGPLARDSGGFVGCW